jgi:hypothetical protein
MRPRLLDSMKSAGRVPSRWTSSRYHERLDAPSARQRNRNWYRRLTASIIQLQARKRFRVPGRAAGPDRGSTSGSTPRRSLWTKRSYFTVYL